MYCRQCGKPVNDNQEFCDECMAKSNSQPVYQTTAEETQSTVQNSNVNNGQSNYVPNNNQNNYNQNNNQANYNQNPQYNVNNNQNQYNQAQYNNAGFNPNAKSKIAAGLLGIFLGALGVHNFYLGFTGKAVAQLLISILSCGTLSWASAIWGLIEGILLLTGSMNVDADGNPLKD